MNAAISVFPVEKTKNDVVQLIRRKRTIKTLTF